MTDETANLILEHLRHLRAGVDGLREDMRELKTRASLVEQQMATLGHMYAGVPGSIASNLGSIASRTDWA